MLWWAMLHLRTRVNILSLVLIVLNHMLDMKISNTKANQWLSAPGFWRERLELHGTLMPSVSFRLYQEMAVIVTNLERWLWLQLFILAFIKHFTVVTASVKGLPCSFVCQLPLKINGLFPHNVWPVVSLAQTFLL